MNLLYKLNEEIQSKHLNTDEKIRYIYLRLCEIFSFDTKWYYANYLNDYNTYRKIKNKYFNVKNIDEFEVVCHTIVPYIMEPLYREFALVDLEIYESDSHTYASTIFQGKDYKLDLTGQSDLAYVKMGLMTKGFKPLMYAFDNEKDIIDMDRSLGFSLLSEEDYKTKLAINPNTTLFEKKLVVMDLFNNSKCLEYYSDAKTFISKMDEIIGIDKQETGTFFSKDYNFHHLYFLPTEDKYFALSKDGKYKLSEVDEEKYKSLSTLYHKTR